MKKNILFAFLILLYTPLFSQFWKLQENQYQDEKNHLYYYYTILSAPKAFKQVEGTKVYCVVTQSMYKNLFDEPCLDEIENYLDEYNFVISKIEDNYCVFLDSTFNEPKKCLLNKKELDYIWKTMSLRYAGLPAMKKRGFTKDDFYLSESLYDLGLLLDKYMQDCHFSINIKGYGYNQPHAIDEGCKKSEDDKNTFFETETSNAYYVRFTNCTGADYKNRFEATAYKAINKDYFVLDARSNSGGSDYPQAKLMYYLKSKKYTGTLIVLQDNWSYSSGELWHVLGKGDVDFKRILVGTHSGGMQNYGNCKTFKNEKLNVSVYFGTTDFTKTLPSNYLGDGKGYEPDVWATTQTMKDVLEQMGVDTGDIVFK